MFRPAAPPLSTETPYRSSLGSSSHSGIFRNDIPSMKVGPGYSARRGWLGQVYGAPPKVANKLSSAVETPKLSSGMPPPSFSASVQDPSVSPMRSIGKPVVPMQLTSGGSFLGNLLFENPMEKSSDLKRSCSLPRKGVYTTEPEEDRRPLTHRDPPACQVPARRDQPMRQSQSLLPPTLSDRILELGCRAQPKHQTLCNSASNDYSWNDTPASSAAAVAKSAKDERKEDETAKASQASGCAERPSSPSKRLSSTLHNEMRGSDLRYLDVKELAQDLKPSNCPVPRSSSWFQASDPSWLQASAQRASAQRKDLGFNLKFNLELMQSQSPQMCSRQAQDHFVQTARTHAAHARGLGKALDGDLRGLEQEVTDVTKDLENVRAMLRRHTPRQ